MHFIIHTIPVKPNTQKRAEAMFREAIPPLAERFSGWRGARLCASDDDQLVAIGMWANEDQMNEFLAQPAFEEAMAGFAELFVGPPTVLITRELAAVGPAA